MVMLMSYIFRVRGVSLDTFERQGLTCCHNRVSKDATAID
jgi:hypothetical protein